MYTPFLRNRRWTLGAATLLILSACSCEYNAEVIVRVPRWDGSTTPVAVLGAYPIGAAVPGGPYAAADCRAAPTRVAVRFLLGTDRDTAVGEGDRLRFSVGGAQEAHLVRPTASELEGRGGVFADQLTLTPADNSAAPSPLTATVEAVRWVAPAQTPTPRLLLVHDHGRAAGDRDPADDRVTAFTELIREALCLDREAINCPIADGVGISIYRLFDGVVEARNQNDRERDALDQTLSQFREQGERGEAPVLTRPGSGGGIDQALDECANAPACRPNIVLITAYQDQPDATLPADLPEGGRVFVAGLRDSAQLRQLACESGGFFDEATSGSALRLLVNRSTSEIPELDYGFARRALLATRGHWEVILTLAGLPADYDHSRVYVLRGSLGVSLQAAAGAEHVELADFTSSIGGY